MRNRDYILDGNSNAQIRARAARSPWGRIEAHIYGMRAEHARIVAIELPLSHGRKRREVTGAAEGMGVPVVPHRSLKALALEHGAVLQTSLRPKKTPTQAANVWFRIGPV